MDGNIKMDKKRNLSLKTCFLIFMIINIVILVFTLIYSYSSVNHYLSKSISLYSENTNDKIDILNKELVLPFLFAFVLIIINCICFGKKMIKPINKLVSLSNKVSDDEFDYEYNKGIIEENIKEEELLGEIRLIYDNIKKITINNAKYIKEVKNKRKLDEVLDKERSKQHQIQTALKEAELRALQSQVNPHFIFNTINIGSRIAMLNDDDVTCEYLENAADIFRYNLNGLDSNVKLKDEINNVKSYMKLLQTRFIDTLKFELQIEDEKDLSSVVLPKMTLQPLVENAYIHGISEYEDGGTILVKTKRSKEENKLFVSIANTGEPIKKDIIEKLLDTDVDTYSTECMKKKKGHTTGIGVNNVLKRLRIYFKTNDIMDIKYIEGMNYFIIKIPLVNDGE